MLGNKTEYYNISIYWQQISRDWERLELKMMAGMSTRYRELIKVDNFVNFKVGCK